MVCAFALLGRLALAIVLTGPMSLAGTGGPVEAVLTGAPFLREFVVAAAVPVAVVFGAGAALVVKAGRVPTETEGVESGIADGSGCKPIGPTVVPSIPHTTSPLALVTVVLVAPASPPV